jgi:hypothetical protein
MSLSSTVTVIDVSLVDQQVFLRLSDQTTELEIWPQAVEVLALNETKTETTGTETTGNQRKL